ncbi:MAG: MarR family transcriptional regulator [Deltaproteobacteria bacterium]|nr:MarR family transcriptional regulator [Deltaproteobacteria bacterium]
MKRVKAEERLTSAFERLMYVLTSGKRQKHDYGTGELLHITESHLISFIGVQPDITSKQIAQALDITKGAVSQTLKKLEKKGYVVKYPKAENLREYCLNLTKKGQTVFKQHEEQDSKLVTSLLNNLISLETEHLDCFSNLLDELIQFVKARQK